MSSEPHHANPHAQPAAPPEFRREVTTDLTPILKHLLAGGTLSTAETTDAFEAMMAAFRDAYATDRPNTDVGPDEAFEA